MEFLTGLFDGFSVKGILDAVTYLIAAASVISQMTPTEKDNKIVGKIGKVVSFFALNWGTDKVAK